MLRWHAAHERLESRLRPHRHDRVKVQAIEPIVNDLTALRELEEKGVSSLTDEGRLSVIRGSLHWRLDAWRTEGAR